MTKLIYIGGYGRSGSTLLEYLLSASPKVVACGEVSAALRRRVIKEICTCGRHANDCPVWSPFKNDLGKLNGWTHKDVTLELYRRLADKNAIMVDSSKTAWRSTGVPFGLVRAISKDFRLVHIVRDPRAVCWSALKKASSKGRIGVSRSAFSSMTVLSWWAANLSCEIFGWIYPDQYQRVRYEDLARSPRDVIARLLPGGDCTFESLEARGNRHQLYGNRMRAHSLSIASVREDDAWQTEMPVGTRRLVYVLSWPLRLRYGYGRTPSKKSGH